MYMYIYVHECMYVCMYVCMYARRDKRIDNWRDFQTEPESKKLKVPHIHTYRTIHTYIHTYIHKFVRTYVYILHVYKQIYIHST